MKTTARFTRQIISILLCIAMVFAYAPTTAIAEERTYDGVTGECYYKLDSEGNLIIWGNGAISGNTFGSNTDITSVVIEEGVTTIGNNAFRNCSNLKSVIIPSSVTAIGNNAFASSGLTTAEYWGTTEPMGASNVFFDTLLLCVNVPTTYDSEVFCGVMAKKTLELVTAYTVTVTNDGNGTGAATPASAAEGEEVTLTATPNTGYKFKEWQVVSGGVTVAEDKFTMGTENVEIKAVFEELSYEASLTVDGVTTNYLTFDEAHAAADEAVGGGAATDKVILKLLKDATVYNGKTFLNGFTLDLNGFTLVPDGGYNYVVNSGYSTIITDSSAGGDGVLKSNISTVVWNAGTLTILGGEFESTNYIYDSVYNNGTLNVKGGIFPGDILNDTSSSASINIYDGVFCDKVGNSGGNGTVNIYGGTFEAASNIYLFSGGTVIIKGGTFKSRLPFELLSNKENVFITISGGAFTNGIELYDGSSPEQYLDDGCAFVDKDGNTVTGDSLKTTPVTVESLYEASVTDKDGNKLSGSPYATIDQAITAAKGSEGSTLKLLDSIERDSQLYIDSGKFTIDLNGKTIKRANGPVITVASGADITIKDSGMGGTVYGDGDTSDAIDNVGTLTIESGNFYGYRGVYNRSGGKLTVNGGEFKGSHVAIYSLDGTVELYDGVFDGGNSGICNGDGNVITVYGGRISGEQGIVSHSTAYIKGGEVEGTGYAAINMMEGTLEVTGGSFTGLDEFGHLTGQASGGEFTVDYTAGDLIFKGGEFPNGLVVSGTTANALLAEDYKFYDKDDNRVTVADDVTKIDGYVQVKECVVASVTDVFGNELSYKAIDEAITAAQGSEGSTLKLMDNIDISSKLYIYYGKFTIDLNGKTIKSLTENVFYINSNAEITIKDSGAGGTVQTNGDASSAISNEGNLTIESGIFKGYIGVDNRVTGILTIKNGKFESGTSAIWNYGIAHLYNGVFEGKGDYASGIQNSSDGVLYVYDGKISGYTAITNYSTAYINGGEFEGTGYAAINMMEGTLEVTGGSFSGTDNEYGAFTGQANGEFTVDYTAGDLVFKGGEFPNGFVVSGTTANALLADGYKFYDKDGNRVTVEDNATEIDGYVQVKEYVVASVIDQYGGKHSYKTIDEALTAAKNINSSTLKLLEDIELSEYLYIDSGNFTIDLNGKTLKNASSYTIRIANGAKITIKDSGAGGTVQTNGDASSAISNEGNLTIESGIFKGYIGVD
ncbi:MAG: leucine-rich repeat domain-containing protein, partial [Ruminococcaceae bacterium]|nr:leucine-rich repeat domain-containing protein [Oscillospiraceae bacterium]